MVRDANELNIHISERMHFSGRMKKKLRLEARKSNNFDRNKIVGTFKKTARNLNLSNIYEFLASNRNIFCPT